ncbi:MAG TPA: MBL fold metallo-hydrolase [Candidatus Baltobacteraceae bacterium]|jgi:glyoxylase-like metal-dependent hydrolase (beta-lactamase superfamily II)|nr:MBL fold metallo-hydrolase [Candidatus Baltobacteraceae bacterium]
MRDLLIIEHFSVGPLACTCTIIADPISGQAIIVDGGAEPERIATRLSALGVRASHLVHTHAHIDHIGALPELRERVGGAGLLHPDDLPLYATLAQQAHWLGLTTAVHPAKIDGDLRHGDRLCVGTAVLEVLHTPGHTPGSVSIALEVEGRALLLTGDTLFRGSVGRWDLGGTSLADIVHSIREHLLVYPDATPVIPGHGPATTIGQERTENPYITTKHV